jgi:hypothetical protein
VFIKFVPMFEGIYLRFALGVDYTFVWMCSLGVLFTTYVFKVIVFVKNSKMTLKTHITVKRKSKLHIQNASVIDL